jgi:hypothetical protein
VISRSTLRSLLAVGALLLPARAIRAEVYCLSYDAQNARFRGAVINRDACIGDEIEVGHPIDPANGIVELFGNEIQIPEGLRIDPNATIVEVEPPPPEPTPIEEATDEPSDEPTPEG